LKSCAILLDTRPAYLQAASATESLLLAPLGPSSVLRHLGDRLAKVGHTRLTVVTDFAFDEEYESRIAAADPRVDAVVSAGGLAAHLRDYEPSDWLVVVDPRCVPAQGLSASAFTVDGDRGPRRARHLVALEAHPGGTTERVQLGANGTVGRIQRFYDSATWPFTSGVACSLLPVSCLMGADDLALGSLRALRRSLAERGVPSQDVFLRGGAFDLTREHHLLGLSEQLGLAHFAGLRSQAGWTQIGPECDVDPTAQLVGPVVLHAGAVIGPNAVVVGPAVIGTKARVEREATVAQCVVGPHAVIAAGATVRHRAVFGDAAGPEGSAPGATPFEPAPPPTVETAEVQDRRQGSSGSDAVLKAVFDVVAAGLGLLVISPLLLLIALLVKLESKGPVFYRGRREGQGGREFDCLKFRTMAVGAEAQQRDLLARNQVDGPQFKMARDPRVTRLGRALRALNLDELPQLLNVLRLEMSLVGPRPSPFRENQLCIPWRDARLSVRPGITGLWQVCRHHRAQGDFHQWIHFDLLYVRHMGFVVDLKILAATLLTLGGHWPVPLSWIVSPRHVEGYGAGATVKVRTTGVRAAAN
jgi:lipopolysaccharide/colanic/teichoic acid biosynthesis glycosyltransferase